MVGSENISTGLNSFASGNLNQALGNFSFASGYEVKVNDNFGVGLGKYITVDGPSSMVFGRYAKTSTSPAMVIGCGSDNSNWLNNPVPNSLMVGFNSCKPTLFVGGAIGNGFTGKVGIGEVTDLQAKLHIRADTLEQASVLIEPGLSSNSAYLYLGNNNYGLKYAPTRLEFFTGGKYVFYNGNVGIGTYQPEAKLQVKDGDIFIEDIDRGIIMKSPDGNCWRGTLDNTGSLHFAKVNCDDLQTGQPESLPANPSKTNIYPNPAGDRVYVSVDESLLGSNLEITDLNGKIVLSQKLFNPESMIDLLGFQTGMYVFNISDSSGKKLESKKVTKQ